MYVPKKIFFTKGVGRHKEYLASFELALRHANIEKYNTFDFLPNNYFFVRKLQWYKKLNNDWYKNQGHSQPTPVCKV